MEIIDAVAKLAAIAQDTRLRIYRLLVEQGPDGLRAGDIGSELALAPATLSFHLSQLSHAGLIRSRRDGRSIIYMADYDSMRALLGFLTRNCCRRDASDRLSPSLERSPTP